MHQRRTTLRDHDRKDRPLRPETLLAGLPRLVRVADETRWRGQSSIATAAVVAAFWLSTWLLDQPVRPGASALAAAVVALPTLAVSSLVTARRVRESLRRTVPPPRATVHETAAASRDRRARLAGVILTGIIVLLIFDRFTGGGGVMAGLMAGFLAAFGASDWVESRLWAEAERERGSRLFVIIRPDALSPRIGSSDVYEIAPSGREGDRRLEPSPFDLEI